VADGFHRRLRQVTGQSNPADPGSDVLPQFRDGDTTTGVDLFRRIVADFGDGHGSPFGRCPSVSDATSAHQFPRGPSMVRFSPIRTRRPQTSVRPDPTSYGG